jgi:hypothetical protein
MNTSLHFTTILMLSVRSQSFKEGKSMIAAKLRDRFHMP